MLIQNYLLNKSLQDLENEHKIYCSFSKSNHKFSLNYDMIESDDSSDIVKECRGLILARENGSTLTKYDVVGKTIPLAVPFFRFFNYGQSTAAKIDWANCSAFIKMDGTLITPYYDPFINQWCVATRSVPEADIDCNGFTFRSLFEKALLKTTEKSFSEFTSNLNKRYTYCFELTSPFNRVVVNYKNSSVTLLMVRDLDSLQELNIYSLDIDCPRVEKFNYTFDTFQNSIEIITKFINSKPADEQEGVVVCDKDFNRIKVKSFAYVMAHKAVSSCVSDRNILQLVLLGKDDDIISFVGDEVKEKIHYFKYGVKRLFSDVDFVFEASKDIPTKKEFALKILSHNIWSAPLFAMYDKKCLSTKEFVEKQKKDESYPSNLLDKILDQVQ